MQCHHVTCNMLPPVSWCLQVWGVRCEVRDQGQCWRDGGPQTTALCCSRLSWPARPGLACVTGGQDQHRTDNIGGAVTCQCQCYSTDLREGSSYILYIEISNSMRTRPVYIEYCCYAPLHQFVTNLLIRILSGQDCIASQSIVCLHPSVTWQSSRRRREKQ